MSQIPAAGPVQPYMPSPYVMMPVAQRNGLGVFGFLVALVGLAVPTGVVSFLGLMISLVALGRSPRGFAATGVVLGLVGTVVWVAITIVALVVGLLGAVAAVVVGGVAFALVQPEVVEITSDMLNVAIATRHHEQTSDKRPTGLEDLGLSAAAMTDPWGNPYQFELRDAEPGFELISAGQDGLFDTSDDILLSRLDRLWERAFEDFGHKMEQLGEKMEAMDGGQYSFHWDRGDCPEIVVRRGDRYYRKAMVETGHRH
ncbi:MAG: type II secretion system protein GspG [Planctomycetota bacterium]|jgi:hypothetical protein